MLKVLLGRYTPQGKRAEKTLLFLGVPALKR